MSLAAVAAGMLMLAYASVPLYRLFCQVTGYGGTTRQAEAAPGRILDRTVTVRFNADVAPGLPWDFRPEQTAMTLKVGENRLAYFSAVNLGGAPTAGVATYNVTPGKAGPYFDKIQCFCFDSQTLGPGEKAEFPVSFFVDPAIADDPGLDEVKTITLSYTFFPLKPE